MRAYNERLVLSLVRRHGSLAKSEIARLTGLSAQTVSVIMRALEAENLLVRGAPQRGRVGQPSVPLSLNPDGVFSLGLKIGRRSADLVLMDFSGEIRQAIHEAFAYPVPNEILRFAAEGVGQLEASLPGPLRKRLGGLGVATPFELWNWAEEVGAPADTMDGWRTFDIVHELGELIDMPVYVQNDATAACGAELVFGRGGDFTDFIYFFVGSFVGGGIVLNGSLYSGRTGNAGALGSMPVPGPNGRPAQLIDSASIVVLERMMKAAGIDPSGLWLSPDDWSGVGGEMLLDEWIAQAAKSLAHATAAACAIIDFEAVILDGGFPVAVRSRLADALRSELGRLDLQGIDVPQVAEGAVGSKARAIGGASLPLFERYLLDQKLLLKGQPN
jgi:predicted NBD/HSP70 family sugar kinase